MSYLKNFENDFIRKKFQLICVLILLSIISGGMTILNLAGQKILMFFVTGLFTIVSIIASVIAKRVKNGYMIASIILEIEVIVMFTFFMINGSSEGFATIWMFLLPSCGCFILGKKHGTILSLIVFVEIVFFFYTAPGTSLLVQGVYTDSFCQRFPIAYLAFFLIGFFLELVREQTHTQLNEAREKYKLLSTHDILTQLYNRAGFSDELDKYMKEQSEKNFAVLIVDIDLFKNINDTYGHNIGDLTLKEVARRIKNIVEQYNGIACRWGGEEFAIILKESNANKISQIAESIRYEISHPMKINDKILNITVSIGVCLSETIKNINTEKMFNLADNELYKAKSTGKNTICVYSNNIEDR